ncbi:hypothetical protein ACXVUM_16595 [Williamsia sp. SKLECPSW1]
MRRPDGTTADRELPVAAWRLEDGGTVVMVSAMGVEHGAVIDAAQTVDGIRSRWPSSTVVMRRPRGTQPMADPRSEVVDYVQLTADGGHLPVDHDALLRRGMRLSHG